MARMNKEDKEVDAVMHFLKNGGIAFKEEEVYCIDKKDSIVDVGYKNLNFQVKNVPAEAEEVDGRLNKEEEVKTGNVGGKWIGVSPEVGKTKMMSWRFNPEESWNKFVYQPLIKVLAKYGKNPRSAKGVILILYGRNMLDAPFLSSLLQESSREKFLSDIGSKIGFDSIYFVGWKENFKLYPRN